MTDNELMKKYKLQTSATSCHQLIHSYSKNSVEPIIFAHYKHEHRVSSRISYRKSNHFCSLFILMSGKFGFIFDKTVYNPSYGDVILMREHEEYTTFFYTNSNVDYYEINFPIEFFESICPENPFYKVFYERDTGEHNMITLKGHEHENVMNKLNEIEAIIKSKNPHSDMLSYSNIVQIMSILFMKYYEGEGHFSTHKIPSKLREAVEYIHQNYLTLSGVDEVSNHCDISGTYLAKMFKNSLYCSPNEYITNLRIANAKYMLKNGATLTDACYKSGFNNYTYFITKFKKVTGITPSKYKK